MVLACCSVAEEEIRREEINELLSSTLDWEYLVNAAGHSACIPQLYCRLKEANDPRIPREVMHSLQGFYQHNSVKNLMLVQEMLRVLRLLRDEGIEAIAYKGPILAQEYYGALSLRMFWDLDLLLRRDDIFRAAALLRRENYTPEQEIATEAEAEFLQTDCEYNFDRADGKVHIELHWDILPRHSMFNFNSNNLWANARQVFIGGEQVLTLAPEDLLLVLCMHAGDKHQWTALRMVQDLAQILANSPGLNWNLLLRQMEQLERKRTVLLGLFLANALLRAPVPQEILLEAQQDPSIMDSAALVMGRLFRQGHGLPGFSEWRHYRQVISGSERARLSSWQNLSHYARSVMEPEFHDREELPRLSAPLAFLHYFARVKRLFFKQRTELLRRLK